jgi:hypothetical protein
MTYFFAKIAVQTGNPDLGFPLLPFILKSMKTFLKILFIGITFSIWTFAQAQNYSGSVTGRGQEMTYDDLVQELSAKKKSVEAPKTEMMGFDRVQAIFGYTFTSLDIGLPSSKESFFMNGIDVRANGQLPGSTWQLEGGFKNLGKVSNGDKSADAKILTAALKNQDYVTQNLQYVAGVSTSLYILNASDESGKRNDFASSLNVTGGLRGALSQQLSWGVDMEASSPVSGRSLKGGVGATVLLSSTL